MERNWKNKSVKLFLEENNHDTPENSIKNKARDLVLKALDQGWEGPPFNPIELAILLDINITPDDSINDALIAPLNKKNEYEIRYNPYQNQYRINFSIAHEISHTLFSDCAEKVRNRETTGEDWELEYLCNIGASEILLPYAIFYNDINSINLSIENLLELSKKYKASLEAVFLRIAEITDKPFGFLMATFDKSNSLRVVYSKLSKSLKIKIAHDFEIPSSSCAYESLAPGWTNRSSEPWAIFEGKKYNITSIGLSKSKVNGEKRVGILIHGFSFEENGLELIEKIKIEYGDATKPMGKGTKIIAQVINTSGALGMGFGKSLLKNYPQVKNELNEWKSRTKEFYLGQSHLIKISDDIYIFQMLAQKGLFIRNGEIPLKYASLQKCLIELSKIATNLNASVHMPQIGAGQAKGDWNIIQGMIYDELVTKGIKVNVYLLPSTGYNPKLKSNLTLFDETSTWHQEK